MGSRLRIRSFRLWLASRNSGLLHAPHVTTEGTYGVSQFLTAMAGQRVKSAQEVKPWFLRDAPGFHLVSEMSPLPSEAIFDKISTSAFEGAPLDMALRDCGIDAFAIVASRWRWVLNLRCDTALIWATFRL
jgi:nicotinamidase-related amidase